MAVETQVIGLTRKQVQDHHGSGDYYWRLNHKYYKAVGYTENGKIISCATYTAFPGKGLKTVDWLGGIGDKMMAEALIGRAKTHNCKDISIVVYSAESANALKELGFSAFQWPQVIYRGRKAPTKYTMRKDLSA